MLKPIKELDLSAADLWRALLDRKIAVDPDTGLHLLRGHGRGKSGRNKYRIGGYRRWLLPVFRAYSDEEAVATANAWIERNGHRHELGDWRDAWKKGA